MGVDGAAVTSAEAARYRSAGHVSSSGPFVEMCVGFDTDEALVGDIGQRAAYDFTAIGTPAKLELKGKKNI